MYRLEREEFTRKPYVYLWALLGFQAGFINAFGFLACGRYVSHLTGFGTQIGVALAHSNIDFALELSGFPLSFMLGAFVSGVLTIARIESGKKPRFDVVINALPIILIFLVVLGCNGVFGPFNERLVYTRDFIMLFLLSFICGLQNSCFAIMTRGQIRTTHLTGIGTDIGSELARIYLGKLNSQELEITQNANFSRIMTFVSFTGGSIVSVFACQRFNYLALLVPLASSIITVFAVRAISQLLDKRFKQGLIN